MVNLLNDRFGVLRNDVRLVNQLPTGAQGGIDGVGWYYKATVQNFTTGGIVDTSTDLILKIIGGYLSLAVPSPAPLQIPANDIIVFIAGGITGYAGIGQFFAGRRVRFAALESEVVMVQEGGNLPMRFYATPAAVFGTGIYRAGIQPPVSTGTYANLVLATAGTGLTGTWEYKLTFEDERGRESSPSPGLSITLANQGTQATMHTVYAPPPDGYIGHNLVTANLYRNTQGAPDVFYKIASTSVPTVGTSKVFPALSYTYDNNAYDDAPDSAIISGDIAPSPGENDPPNPASVIAIWKNRVLLNDVTDSTTIQISNTLSTTQFTSVPTSPIVATDGARTDVGTDQGDPITAIADFGSYAAIFKRRATFFLSGNDLSDFLIQPVYDRGCIAPDSCVRCNNSVLFLSDDGVYAASYGGGDIVQKVSKEIEADLLSFSQVRREASIAWFIENTYFLSVYDTVFAYNFDVLAWTTFNFGPGFSFDGANSGDFGSIVPALPPAPGSGVDACSVTLSVTDIAAVVAGETDTVTITAGNSAAIGYTSDAVWVHLSGGPTNSSGTLTIEIDENTDALSRTATIGICEEVLTITQEGAGPPLGGCGGDIQSLIHWYKADANVYSDTGLTLAVNNDPVRQWNDQVGVEHLSQSTLGYRPIYVTGSQNSLPGVDFDGVDDLLVAAATTFPAPPSTPGYEMFFVWKLKTWADSKYLMTYSPDKFRVLTNPVTHASPDGIIYTAGFLVTTPYPNLYPGAWSIMNTGTGAIVAGKNRYVQVNTDAALTDSGSFDAIVSSSLCLGGGAITPDASMSAITVGEILIYACPLSPTERTAVLAYLNEKWAVY